ncbi:MAG: NAD(P)H-dependent oxidoreductase [Polyangiales bacterium]
MIDLLGISGSLRADSLNSMLLRAMQKLVPDGATLTVRSVADVPLYNGDLDVEGGPDGVRSLKADIDAADGLVIATPEYNYGVPGVLKNAIDWVSRPAFKSVLVGKPVAIVGAAPGIVGTARAQAELRNVLFGTLAEVFPHPEVLVGQAHQRMADGKLTDEASRKIIADMLDRYVARIGRSA